MAEIIDLNINIGANTTDFESALQKAENLLKQFEGALKKATNVGEINYLNTQIKGLQGTISGIKTQMSSVARPTADATNALSNLSRVAQDAPYGFIGIANNLNPLLESFQRLQKESVNSGGALKAMISGLTGPAGIGLALGVVSSLAVTYSKEISDFFKGPTDELKKFREELNKLNADVYKVAGEAQANRSKGINLVDVIVGKDQKAAATALISLQDLYTKNADIQNAKLGKDRAYYTSLVNLASLQELAIGKEANNEDQLKQLQVKRKQLQAQRNAELKEAEKLEGIFGFPKAARVSAEKMRVGIRYDAELANLDKLIAEAQAKNKEFVKAVSEFETPDKKEPKDSEAVTYAKYELKKLDEYVKKLKERVKEAQFVLKYETFQLYQSPSEKREDQAKRGSYFAKQAKELTDKSNETGLGAFLMKDAKSRIISYDAEEKKIKELSQAYENFANMLASNLTSGIMDVFAAFEEGRNPLEAIADMFLNIAKSIAAAILQAVIFQAILTAFPELKAVFAASGALQGAFGGKRLAEGGITNGASIAMIGEAGPEAVLPLSKLNTFMQTSFNAGAMSGSGYNTGGTNVAVLRGQDLLVAINRTQKSSFLKGQNISLI
jgi:hypothetical protein